MTVVQAVCDRLLAITTLTALVGARVTALVLDQSADLPAIRVQQISRNEDLHLRGSVGLVTSRVQVDHFAKVSSGQDPYAMAHAMAAAARGTFNAGAATGLHGFAGTVGAMDITDAALIDEREEFEADELLEVRVSQDYLVRYRSA